MALETLSSNELLNFIIYDTISATPFSCNDSSETTTTTTNTTTTTTTTPCSSSFFLLENQNLHPPPPPPPNPFSHQEFSAMEIMSSNSNLTTTTAKMSMAAQAYCAAQEVSEKNSNSNNNNNQNLGVQGGKKKRRRRPRVCKNKEEAENQRMTHIAVERNRRKQMNEHLAVLRSLMPESYVQRGDQASIVGGAIEFVKELEHLLQTLEAQKFLITQKQPQEEEEEEEVVVEEEEEEGLGDNNSNFANNSIKILAAASTPFSQFFSYPQYTCSQIPNKYTSKSRAAIADIEVTLIETHANLRILSQKRLLQLSKMVACFQTLHLSVLHLNITTLDPLVLYSISVKVEEGCRLNSADEIAGAVHQMLRIIEEEANNSIC